MSLRELLQDPSPSPYWYTRIDFLGRRVGTSVLLMLGSSASATNPNSRNMLPEPFDFFDHANNFALSGAIGLLTSMALVSAYEKVDNMSLRRVRAVACAGACLVAGVANMLAETKMGVKLLHWENFTTPDMVDLVYGVPAAAITAPAVIGAVYYPRAD